jgi:plastocyanin
MTTMDKAAIAWSIAIVAAGVGMAIAGQSGQNFADVQSQNPAAGSASMQASNLEKTAPQTDPFADIAEKVKQNPSSTQTVKEELSAEAKTTGTMKEETKTFEEGLATSNKPDVVAQQEAKDVAEEAKKVEEKVAQEETKAGQQAEALDEGAPTDVVVTIAAGTSVPGCEETDSCFNPHKARVQAGGEVTWVNEDTAAHTVTSGTPSSGPDGVFDSSLLLGGKSFTQTFDTQGEYNYFCMVHPWMAGLVQVE